MNNVWVELQEARKIIAILKKEKDWNLDESTKHGLYVITDKNGDSLYQAKSYDREHTLLYAIHCHKNGYTPSVLGLQEFDFNE